MSILKAPVFILCLSLFLLHQFLQKVLAVQIPFVDPYLDSFLAMPILLTLLVVERRLLFRKESGYCLKVWDVVIATIFIAFVVEVVFPAVSDRFTADWWDVVAYGLGSLLFYYTINRFVAQVKERQNRSNTRTG